MSLVPPPGDRPRVESPTPSQTSESPQAMQVESKGGFLTRLFSPITHFFQKLFGTFPKPTTEIKEAVVSFETKQDVTSKFLIDISNIKEIPTKLRLYISHHPEATYQALETASHLTSVGSHEHQTLAVYLLTYPGILKSTAHLTQQKSLTSRSAASKKQIFTAIESCKQTIRSPALLKIHQQNLATLQEQLPSVESQKRVPDETKQDATSQFLHEIADQKILAKHRRYISTHPEETYEALQVARHLTDPGTEKHSELVRKLLFGFGFNNEKISQWVQVNRADFSSYTHDLLMQTLWESPRLLTDKINSTKAEIHRLSSREHQRRIKAAPQSIAKLRAELASIDAEQDATAVATAKHQLFQAIMAEHPNARNFSNRHYTKLSEQEHYFREAGVLIYELATRGF